MQLLPSAACAFAFALAPQPRAPPLSMRMPTWVPAEALDEISEAAARDAFENMQTVNLELPESVATGPVAVTYLSTNVKPNPDQPPVMVRVLLPRTSATDSVANAHSTWQMTLFTPVLIMHLPVH